MGSSGTRDLGQTMAKTTTRRDLLKRGGGALAAMGTIGLTRVAGAQPNAFVDAPGGERILRLLGAKLGHNEGTERVNTGTQTLVLVMAGRVAIMTHGGGDPIVINAGGTVAFGTGMTLMGAASGKNRFVAAQIL